jgi:Amt family ammonium transporter
MIDDPVGAFPVHGACGLWGGVATGLFGDIPEGLERASFIKVQCLSSAIIAVWAFSTMCIVFFGLKALGMLRVTPEEEIEGLDIGEHGMHAYYLDSPPA